MLKDAGKGLPFSDLTSNQFIDGMRKIYELEPFIKMTTLLPLSNETATPSRKVAF